MKKNINLSLFLIWALLAVVACNTSSPLLAMEQRRQEWETKLTSKAKELITAFKNGDEGAKVKLLEGLDSQELIDRALEISSYHSAHQHCDFLVAQKIIADYVPSQRGLGKALLKSSYDGPYELVTLLLEKGLRGDPVSLALTEAAKGRGSRNTHVVKALLDAGADANYQNENGNTPLHNAVWDGQWPLGSLDHPPVRWRVGIVTILLKKGANLHIKNLCGSVPWDIAAPMPKQLIKEEIARRHGADALHKVSQIEQGKNPSRPFVEEEIGQIFKFLSSDSR